MKATIQKSHKPVPSMASSQPPGGMLNAKPDMMRLALANKKAKLGGPSMPDNGSGPLGTSPMVGG